MVGRGGRSKACLDCRKRRLKCVFIDERPKLNNDRDPFSEDLALRYLRSTVFPGADDEDTAPWPGFNAIHMPDSLAYRCLLLLALTYFGRAQVSNDILHAGSKMYVGSLTTLNENLRHPRKSRSNDTLLSIIILGIYEMLVLSSQDGWINHTLGLAAVIEMRGPALHQQGSPALQAFEASRFLIILASLAVSKATFLSQPQWKSTPCIDYQLSSSNPMIAQLIVLFPMRMAWKALKGHSTPEGRWIEDKLRQLSNSKQNWQVLQQTITFKAGPTTTA
ncbi:hypothetical protein DV736_g6473, partial [Chaetothyriales sp. CBS 134916]